MKKELNYYGGFRTSKIYDGSIRNIENNKSVVLEINRDNAIKIINYLSKYLLDDNKKRVIITAYKEQKNNDGFHSTIVKQK